MGLKSQIVVSDLRGPDATQKLRQLPCLRRQRLHGRHDREHNVHVGIEYRVSLSWACPACLHRRTRLQWFGVLQSALVFMLAVIRLTNTLTYKFSIAVRSTAIHSCTI